MPVRDSWAVGATTDRRVGADDARLGNGALLAGGTTPITTRNALRQTPGSPGLVQATGTPSINVTVNAFQAAINASRGYGPYIATLDATLTVPILDVPADPSNARWDLIVAQQSDVDYGDANRDFWVGRVRGTAAASPSDPAVTTGNGAPTNSPDYLLLGRARVAAGALAITNVMIDDLRPGWMVGLGGVLPVANQAVRDALTGTRVEGLTVWRMDRKWLETWDATLVGWRVQGTAVCASVADRNAAITSPYAGLYAITTDTSTLWLYSGTAWVAFGNRQLWVQKALDENVLNSTAFQDDDHLLLPVEANAVYVMDSFLQYKGAFVTTGDLKCQWTGPVGFAMQWASYGVNASSPASSYDVVQQSATSGRALGTNGAPTPMTAQPKGYVTTGANAGTLRLQWAQNTANATTPTTMLAGSWLRLTRVA